MKFRNLISAVILTALPLAATAATIVVPVAGTGPGANASQWQSELTLHTAAPRPVTLSLTFHRGTEVSAPVAVTLEPRETISFSDVVKTKFGYDNASGSILIDVSDRDARTVAVASRVLNVSPNGEFGQDIAATAVSDALRPGDIAALSAPAVVAGNRFNFGVYASEAASIEWRVLRADGSVAGTKQVAYAAGQHAQYNAGVETLVGVTPANNDTVQGRVISGRAIFYGSIVAASGDPSFVPGVKTRDDILIQFAGIDLDENGTVDIVDADGDGVLDAPVQVITSMYSAFFDVIASGEFGENVQLELISAPEFTKFVDPITLRVTALGDLSGKSGEILVKATAGNTSTILTIPMQFR